jgi:hypothetical protein
MRSSIQLLVQHTGPLGTCMDYIQEDVSLMTAELHRWEEDCRRWVLCLCLCFCCFELCCTELHRTAGYPSPQRKRTTGAHLHCATDA